MSTSAASVDQYNYFCSTENVELTQYVPQGSAAPTTCIHGSNHVISDGSMTFIQTIGPSKVQVIADASGATGGRYFAQGVAFNAAANSVTSNVQSWPFNVSVIEVNLLYTPSMQGDVISTVRQPNVDQGLILGADVPSGATTFNATADAISHLTPGIEVQLTDGTNNNDLGQIESYDPSTNVVTFTSATTNAFSKSNTHALTSVYVANQLEIPENNYGHIDLANHVAGSSFAPAGTQFKISYTNNSGAPKRIVIHFKMFY